MRSDLVNLGRMFPYCGELRINLKSFTGLSQRAPQFCSLAIARPTAPVAIESHFPDRSVIPILKIGEAVQRARMRRLIGANEYITPYVH